MQEDYSEQATIALVRGAQSGDSLALEELFSRYQPRVVKVVEREMGAKVRARHSVEDIAQDVLFSMYAGLEGFEMRHPAALRGWMRAIVRSTILRKVKRDRLEPRERPRDREGISLQGDVFVGSGTTPSGGAMNREYCERLRTAVREMNRRHRKVFILRAFRNWEYSAIVEHCRLTNDGAARVMYARARAKFVSALARSDADS